MLQPWPQLRPQPGPRNPPKPLDPATDTTSDLPEPPARSFCSSPPPATGLLPENCCAQPAPPAWRLPSGRGRAAPRKTGFSQSRTALQSQAKHSQPECHPLPPRKNSAPGPRHHGSIRPGWVAPEAPQNLAQFQPSAPPPAHPAASRTLCSRPPQTPEQGTGSTANCPLRPEPPGQPRSPALSPAPISARKLPAQGAARRSAGAGSPLLRPSRKADLQAKRTQPGKPPKLRPDWMEVPYAGNHAER